MVYSLYKNVHYEMKDFGDYEKVATWSYKSLYRLIQRYCRV